MSTEQKSLLCELTEQEVSVAASALHLALFPEPVKPWTEHSLVLVMPPVGFPCNAEHWSSSPIFPGPPATWPVLQEEPPPPLPFTEQVVLVLLVWSDCVEQVSSSPSWELQELLIDLCTLHVPAPLDAPVEQYKPPAASTVEQVAPTAC
jgi:hypothetical protein